MRKALLTASMASLFLSGCASVQHDCPLGEECVNTQDAYEAAVKNGGNRERVLKNSKGTRAEMMEAQEEDRASRQNSEEGAPAMGQWKPYAGGGLTDNPVYNPPEPVRIWIAPWKGEDGYLRSGQHIYANQPGHWSFGNMRTPGVGASAGMLTPNFTTRSKKSGNEEEGTTNTNRVQPEQTLGPNGGVDLTGGDGKFEVLGEPPE